MMRDSVLLEKDRVQKMLWIEAGRDMRKYVELIHKKAKELQRAGMKLKYAR
jgi:hypothetical protein